jgi:hypothetical protein
MKASILIVTRNRGKQLRATLASIRRQAYQDVEIVVVDDASSDETRRVIAEQQLDGMALVTYRLERSGGSASNPAHVLNIGHRACAGAVVIEQGGDVCHLTDCVGPLLDACVPGTVALARVYHGTAEEMRLVEQEIADDGFSFGDDLAPDTVRTCGSDWAVPRVGRNRVRLYCGRERPAPFLLLGAIRKEDFAAVGGYDPARLVGNDEDLANRLIAKGVKFRFVGRAVAFHQL